MKFLRARWLPTTLSPRSGASGRRPPRSTTSLAHTVVAFVALATALTGQLRRTAHPQETIQAANGTLLPFGCLGPTAFTEGRTQILLRNQELPGPGAMLVGIEVHCQNTLTLEYASLEINACPTTATSLSLTFADNLTAPVQSLLRATNFRVLYDGSGWSPILLRVPYVHDGVSDLVIEVSKIVNPVTAQFATMNTTSNPPRRDLPAMVASFGGPGSGAATAASAQTLTAPLSMRLLWFGVPTVRLLSDRGPSGNQFALGGSVNHTVDGSPGAFTVNFLGTLLDSPVFLPPLVGRVLIGGTPVGGAVVDATGHFQQPFAIPNDGNLVGLHLAFQSATVDAQTGIVLLTNAVDLFVNP